jgi:hypothetical protein
MICETEPDWLYRGAAARRVWAPAHVSVTGGPQLLGGGFSSLLDYTFWCMVLSLYVNMTCGPSLVIFNWHPAKIDIHQNSWNSVS